jgi:hypothetical protein
VRRARSTRGTNDEQPHKARLVALCVTVVTGLVAVDHVDAREPDPPDPTAPQRVLEVDTPGDGDPDNNPVALPSGRVVEAEAGGPLGVPAFPQPWQCERGKQAGACPDPQVGLRHAFSLSPGILPGEVTSCMRRRSRARGRHDLCRLVYGIDSLGGRHNMNWLIDGCLPGQPLRNGGCERIIRAKGSNTGNYKYAIVSKYLTGDNLYIHSYEGCRWQSPTNNYWCDYRTARHIVLNLPGNAWRRFLKVAWSWTGYLSKTAGCAGSIHRVWIRAERINLPFLTACLDGPLGS